MEEKRIKKSGIGKLISFNLAIAECSLLTAQLCGVKLPTKDQMVKFTKRIEDDVLFKKVWVKRHFRRSRKGELILVEPYVRKRRRVIK